MKLKMDLIMADQKRIDIYKKTNKVEMLNNNNKN